jgi:protein-disulfide isomerase
MVVHTCGLIFAFLMLRSRMTTTTQKSLVAGFSAVGVAGMVILQMVTPAPENYEIITYEVEEPSTDGTTDSDLFAPPGEVFESPAEVAEVFEAPGEVFEAPALEQEPAETKSAQSGPSKQPESSGESVKVDSSNPVAATVLSILPPRLLLLSDLLGALPQQAEATAAQPAADAGTSVDPVKSDEAKAEPNKSDEAVEADGDEPVAAELAESDTDEANAKATSEPAKPAPPERRVVTVAGNRVTLDVRQWPLLGKPDARYVFVEMFDYTCPHCRTTHQAIKGAFANYGDKLAILALPVPLESQCNKFAKGGGHAGACELARIAVTVWRVNPAKFHEFHDWLFEANRPASVAKAHAEKLVGVEAFRKEYGSDIPNQYIKRHVDMYEKVGQGAVPKLLFPKSTINGVISSTATLSNTIERELK